MSSVIVLPLIFLDVSVFFGILVSIIGLIAEVVGIFSNGFR